MLSGLAIGFKRRNVIGLALMNTFRGMVVGGYMVLYGLYLAYLGYDMSVIGLASAIASLVGALLSPLGGYLIGKWGSRVIISLSGIALSASLLILAIAKSLPLLITSYTLFMLSFLYGQAARSTFLAHSVGIGELGISVGITGAVFSITRSIGPSVAGFIAHVKGFEQSFSILTLLSVIGLVVFWTCTVQPPGEAEKEKHRSLVNAYRKVFKPSSALASVYPIVILDRVGWSLWFPLLSAHMYNYGYNEAIVGMLSTIQSIAWALMLPLFGRLADKIGSITLLITSELLGIVAALLLIYPIPMFKAIIAYVFIGAGIASWIPSYNKLIAVAANGNMLSEAYASVNTIRIIPSIPAPLIGGILYDTFGPLVPYTSSSMVLAAVVALLTLKLRGRKGKA